MIKWNILQCLILKIASIAILGIAWVYIPYLILSGFYDLGLTLRTGFGSLMVMSFMWLFHTLFYKALLSTNNPATRKNIFSINKRYANNTTKSNYAWEQILTDPLLEPNEDELNVIKRKERKKTLEEIL